MSYVKIPGASWHSFLTFTRTGAVLTRCGRHIPGPDHELSDSLPMDGRSCESCLRLAVYDGERPVTTDTVADVPAPESDEVAG